MIPIIYEPGETSFISNGLGRLRDCIECNVTEERNGIYECDFSYPIDGANFDLIQCGRIIGVTHDDDGKIQPFDIVSYSKPIDGIVDFHAVHVSYRQSGIVAKGTNISSISDAFAMLTDSAEPSNPFTYETDITSTAYMASADGVPRSVRQFLGGIEGSILDAYGGEYEFDRFHVILHNNNRGIARDFAIRYGVNLLDYKDDTDYSETYTSCIPYWKGNDNGAEVLVIGDRVDMTGTSYNGRNMCAALDLSDKFQDKPTKAQVQTLASTLMRTRQTNLPKTSISVDFVRLQDMGYEELDSLLQCNLCDTIKVEFPRYNMSGTYKIVKTVWNVLENRYNSMELGALSTSLSDALGISNSLGGSSGGQTDIVDYVIAEGGNGNPNTWNYRKWQSGLLECWARFYSNSMNVSGTAGSLKFETFSISNRNYPVAFVGNYPTVTVSGNVTNGNGWAVMNNSNYSLTQLGGIYVYAPIALTGVGVAVNVMAIGRWK